MHSVRTNDSPTGLIPGSGLVICDPCSHVRICICIGLCLVEQLVCLVPTCFIYTVYDDQDLLSVHGPVLMGARFYDWSFKSPLMLRAFRKTGKGWK